MATSVKRPSGRDEILDAVLDAADRLFAAAGPAHVSLRAIAQEAGVNYGLVHRHFGTKDDLFDQVLQRYATRWTSILDTGELGYAEVIEQMLRTGRDTGDYLRLLAWTLLSDRDEQSDPHRRPAALDRLPALRGGDEDEATMATAAALAFAFGWRFFNPFIRSALHLEDVEDDAVMDRMTAVLRGIIAPR